METKYKIVSLILLVSTTIAAGGLTHDWVQAAILGATAFNASLLMDLTR